MKTITLIQDLQFEVDVEATRVFYLSQHTIPEDCDCEECTFYFEEFIHRPYKMLELLSSLGIDLGKNLSTLPTGVWGTRDDDGSVIHFDTVYQAKGRIKSPETKELHHSVDEDGLNMKFKLTQVNSDTLDFIFQVCRVKVT